MTTIKPTCLLYGDEELRPVGVFTGIGHAQPAGAVVLQLEVLIFEALAVDRFACKETVVS